MRIIAILIYLIFLVLPSVGIFAYYKRFDTLFYITSIISAIIWLIGIIVAFATAPAIFGIFVIGIPLILGFLLKQSDGYNMLLLASCFGVYLSYLYALMYGNAMGHWSI